MEVVRAWLLSLIAVSLLCASAGALMPKGAVRQVGRLVCGLVMLAAILSPVARLDAAEGRRWLAGYFASVEQRRAGLEETVNNQMKHIIEGEYAAYIVDKAAELGLTCTAQVECQRSAEGLYLPVRTEVTGMLTEDIRIQLVRTIAEDLGVPERAQVYYTK
ncbi:MAG: stage III sporulation protein AF [Lawsonibacter sp.]|nr:stage III sporulation protein AF [Lawsonibacter sp.]